MGYLKDKIVEITERSAFWLAGSDQADTFSPDALDSPGAEFLDSVKRAALEWWDLMPNADRDEADSDAAEQTDSCVPVYTHTLWMTFVDLGAYHEEVDDLGFSDMGDMASYALHQIAERLFIALIAELVEAREEDEAEAAEDEEEDSFGVAALEEIIDTIGADNVIDVSGQYDLPAGTVVLDVDEDGECEICGPGCVLL